MVLILAAHENHLEAFTNFNIAAKVLGEGNAFQGSIVDSSIHQGLNKCVLNEARTRLPPLGPSSLLTSQAHPVGPVSLPCSCLSLFA